MQWKPVPSLDGYEVSDDGRVRTWISVSAVRVRRGDKIIGQMVIKKEATPTMLVPWREKKTKILNVNTWRRYFKTARKGSRSIASMVAEAFHGPRPYYFAIHLDGNQDHNEPGNLKWGTRSDATKIAIKRGVKRGSGRQKLSEVQVLEIVRRIRAGEQQLKLAKEFGVSKVTISHIGLGRVWSSVTGIKPSPIEEEF